MKIFTRLIMLLGLTLGGWSSVAWGYTYACEPSGATRLFYPDFGNYAVTDGNQNQPGTLFPNAATYNTGGTASMTCDCQSGVSYNRYFWSKNGLPVGTVIDGQTYYTVSEYLQANISIFLGGNVNQYIPLPWEALDNQRPDAEGCNGKVAGDVTTGNKGKISLRIAKAFVGNSVISNLKVADIYVGRSPGGSYGSTPIVSVYLSGSVTVPQSCAINAGQIVTVDFGQLWAGGFKEQGQKAGLQPDKTVTVPIKCNNIEAGANLTLRFQAEPSPDYSEAIKTTNPDVGVVVKDDRGNLITPNLGLIPFSLDDNQSATVTFHLSPVSTTGNQPEGGAFQAQAYIRVDFA